jgi:hypothetical protein
MNEEKEKKEEKKGLNWRKVGRRAIHENEKTIRWKGRGLE